MNLQSGKRFGGGRPCSTALLLFVLVAHAFFVSSTHHHLSRLQHDDAVSHGAVASGGQTSDAGEVSGETSCLSCRLQRNYVFEAEQAVIFAPKPLQKTVRVRLARLEPHTNFSRLLLSDRAPPRS